VPVTPVTPEKRRVLNAQAVEGENEAFEERAAIMEFDGGLPREEAERAAMEDCHGNYVADVRHMVEQDEEEPTTLLEDRAGLLPGEKPCMVCQHSRRPGTKIHCREEARPDLPLAYGVNHPLRQLPDDMGLTCKSFHPNWRNP
jgi:hypothetical protein